jgi:hypothetical protein
MQTSVISESGAVQRSADDSCTESGRHSSAEAWASSEGTNHDCQFRLTSQRVMTLHSLKIAFAQPFHHWRNASVWSFSILTLDSSGYDNLLPVFLHYGFQGAGEADFHPSMGLAKGKCRLRLCAVTSPDSCLDTKSAGIILTCYSLIVLIAALFLNPLLCKLWSPSHLFRACTGGLCTAYVLLAIAVAITNETVREAAIYGCMMIELCCSYTAMQNCLLVMTRSVEPDQLTSMHGLTATLAGIAKSVGVVMSGSAFSISARYGFVSGPWWTLAIVASITFFCSIIAEAETAS